MSLQSNSNIVYKTPENIQTANIFLKQLKDVDTKNIIQTKQYNLYVNSQTYVTQTDDKAARFHHLQNQLLPNFATIFYAI